MSDPHLSCTGPPQKPKDDETIVKNVVRNLVLKVSRRLAPKHRRRSRTNAKEGGTNNDNQQQDNQENNDVDQQQPRQPRRGRGRRGGNRPDSGYYMQPGKKRLAYSALQRSFPSRLLRSIRYLAVLLRYVLRLWWTRISWPW